jgi:hypothetical protein
VSDSIKEELCLFSRVWVFVKGNLSNLIEMTHWKGNDVLYIGDHIYGDLAVSCLI